MRKLLLVSFLLMPFFYAQAQQQTQKIVRDHYSVSGGILGAANYSRFRITNDNQANLSYDWRIGWSAGLWINFPLANSFSLEPQVMYSSYYYKLNNLSAFLLNDGRIDYISVPLLFKFHLGPKVALTLGPQYDLLTSLTDKRNNSQKDDFEKSSFSAFGGFEILPHERVTIFARYIHGFTNMDNTNNPNTTIKYYNEVIQAGLKLRLFGMHSPSDSDGDGIVDSKDQCLLQPGVARYNGCPIPDTDKDGVNDEIDKCPSQAGVARYNGCPIPDRDKDGVNDEEDKCPDQSGLPKYNGCPIPDTDKDGVNDEEDKCPNQAGSPKYQGCPVPDTDGDGINDDEDRCPETPGVPEMKGCPKIAAFEASRVTFASGKSILTQQGQKELDIVVAFIKRAPEAIKVKLSGHTDSTGSDKINDPLSLARADAAKAYLVKNGIDASRILTEGFGSKNPVAENKTAKGRAKNRRVEVTVE